MASHFLFRIGRKATSCLHVAPHHRFYSNYHLIPFYLIDPLGIESYLPTYALFICTRPVLVRSLISFPHCPSARIPLCPTVTSVRVLLWNNT